MYYDETQDVKYYMYGGDEAPAGTGKGEQNYADIVNGSIASGKKFEDPLFPADASSLEGCGPFTYNDYDENMQVAEFNYKIEWMRPEEIASRMGLGVPKFRGEYTQFGVNQGMVGDCWFLATLADVALHPDCINLLVPVDNYETGFFTGTFRFRFWCRGKWLEVTIDDKLPCGIIGDYLKVETLFSKPSAEGGFWAPLLEKAYAKMYGGYGRIDRGLSTDAMMDFTGGFVTDLDCSLDERKQPGFPNLLALMKEAKENNDIMTLGTFPKPPYGKEAVHDPGSPGNEGVSSEGMVAGHAYSILDIQTVEVKNDPSKKITLVKLRNPWGNYVEWNGPFSDRDDRNWDGLAKDLRRKSGQRLADGEFWLPYNCMLEYIAALFTCRWDGKFRGTEIDSFCHHGGKTLFMDFSNFTQENSGPGFAKPIEFMGKKAYLVNLKPRDGELAEPDSMKDGLNYNCRFCVDMVYLNYTRSSSDPAIPEWGYYIMWSEGQLHPSDNIFLTVNEKVLFESNSTNHRRRLNFQKSFPEGTLCIIPWITTPPEKDIPFAIRIYVDGDVWKY